MRNLIVLLVLLVGTTMAHAQSGCNIGIGGLSPTAPLVAACGGTGVNNGTSQITITIASGTLTLNTTAISSGACSAAQTATATGTATTDAIQATFNADPTSTTGYIPTTAGMLTIIHYPTLNTVNFKVCNNTANSITPGAVTLNWRVTR